MEEEYGMKFLKGKNSKSVTEAKNKAKENLENVVVKGNIYEPEACINYVGMKSYIPSNFADYAGIKMDYYYFVMEPGYKVVSHIHPLTDELYFILGGEGVFSLNGKKFDLKKGDTRHILAGQWHSLDTTNSKTNLEIFIVSAPAIPLHIRSDGFEGFTEEEWEKMGYSK